MLQAKEYFKSEVSTFFNLSEFAEMHIIDGKDIAIVIDNDELKKRQIKYAEGIYSGDLLFYAKKLDFEEIPIVEQRMKCDGELYEVTDVQETEGMYIITLKGYRS